MFNPTEADEQNYLHQIIEKLKFAYEDVDEAVTRYAEELRELKSYMYENKTGMDAAEKSAEYEGYLRQDRGHLQ